VSLKKEITVLSKIDGKPILVRINPYWVAAFLNGRIGQLQIE